MTCHVCGVCVRQHVFVCVCVCTCDSRVSVQTVGNVVFHLFYLVLVIRILWAMSKASPSIVRAKLVSIGVRAAIHAVLSSVAVFINNAVRVWICCFRILLSRDSDLSYSTDTTRRTMVRQTVCVMNLFSHHSCYALGCARIHAPRTSTIETPTG